MLAPSATAEANGGTRTGSPQVRKLEQDLRRYFNCFYDEGGNIGRRYRRQDEVGTPYCVTYDFDSEEDAKVTVRDRDTMNQDRIPSEGLVSYLRDRLEAPL